LRLVVPAHGPPAGPEFLATNAAYLEGLLAGAVAPPTVLLPDFYRQGHQRNLEAVRGQHRRT
jgi:hypothetical protein